MAAFFEKFLIFAALMAVTYSRYLSKENVLESQDTNCSCDWRYFKHYETKGCLVETIDSCGCPQKFTCPTNQTQQAAAKVCIYQNKEYKVGSKIVSSDICQVCRCRDGITPYISCITRECPEISGLPGQDCHLVYEESKCCPVRIRCFENETLSTSNKTCEYGGKIYPFGSKIYPIDDPCQTCICDENWNGADNSSCYQQECMFEKNRSKLDAGCIPVYHETRCCPVEFYCPSSYNISYSVLSSNESSDNYNISYDDQCIFAGQYYALGEELYIDNSCVKCICSVPPDFTCIHQTCPPSPNEQNCYATYNTGKCCPTYECMLGDAESDSEGCPTPICADSSCIIETPPGHECPTCVCDEGTSELEHNNLEQAQQVSQNLEHQFEHVQQIFQPNGGQGESSEEELQMMPIKMQDADDQISVMEKMILPELDSGLRELEENSFEDSYSTESINTPSEEIWVVENENSTSQSKLDLDSNFNKSVSNQSEKVVQKRSDVSDAANSDEIKVIPAQQFSSSEHGEIFDGGIEREGGDSDEKHTAFDDELENLRNKIVIGKNKTINEKIKINHLVKVPPGCPTPLCEGPWCKIGILPGEKCPTCICKRHEP